MIGLVDCVYNFFRTVLGLGDCLWLVVVLVGDLVSSNCTGDLSVDTNVCCWL